MSDERAGQVRHDIRIIGDGREWPDYVVHAWMINSAVVGVEAVECIGLEGDELLFLKKGWVSSPTDSTHDPLSAETIVGGSIKWDGCSDLMLGRGGYIHSCGRSSAVMIGALIDRLYSIAKDMLKVPTHNEAMFDGR